MLNDTQAPVASAPARPTTLPLPTSGDTEHGSCPECSARTVSQASDGSEYCRECGLVLSDVPVEQTEPGWVPLSERRTGPASSVSHESIGTKIGAGGDYEQTARLNKYNNRLDYRTRALKDGLREVRSLCSGLELPSTTEEHAAHLYRRALSANLVQGRSQECIAGACVYVSTRQYHQPVMLSDVASASPVAESSISGAYRVVLQELGIGVQPPEPIDFLAKIAAKANLDYRVERRAGELLRQAVEEGRHVGQNPSGVAAAALYAGARPFDEDVTQADVAEAAGVSTVTLSRQWQTFAEYLE